MSRHLLITGDYAPRSGGQARFLRDLRRRMALAGRERVVTRFSRESGATAFTEVLDELAGPC